MTCVCVDFRGFYPLNCLGFSPRGLREARTSTSSKGFRSSDRFEEQATNVKGWSVRARVRVTVAGNK